MTRRTRFARLVRALDRRLASRSSPSGRRRRRCPGDGGADLVVDAWREGAVKTLQLGVGRSVIVDLPEDAAEIFVGEPKVANAVVRSARRIYVSTLATGQTTIFALAADGRKIAVFEDFGRPRRRGTGGAAQRRDSGQRHSRSHGRRIRSSSPVPSLRPATRRKRSTSRSGLSAAQSQRTAGAAGRERQQHGSARARSSIR